jgi:hypothetical protein
MKTVGRAHQLTEFVYKTQYHNVCLCSHVHSETQLMQALNINLNEEKFCPPLVKNLAQLSQNSLTANNIKFQDSVTDTIVGCHNF